MPTPFCTICATVPIPARAQIRVLSLLTAPPSLLTKVWPERENVEQVTETKWSKVRKCISSGLGVLFISPVSNNVSVQGVFQLLGL